jgi:hypothetical protein
VLLRSSRILPHIITEDILLILQIEKKSVASPNNSQSASLFISGMT